MSVMTSLIGHAKTFPGLTTFGHPWTPAHDVVLGAIEGLVRSRNPASLFLTRPFQWRSTHLLTRVVPSWLRLGGLDVCVVSPSRRYAEMNRHDDVPRVHSAHIGQPLTGSFYDVAIVDGLVEGPRDEVEVACEWVVRCLSRRAPTLIISHGTYPDPRVQIPSDKAMDVFVSNRLPLIHIDLMRSP